MLSALHSLSFIQIRDYIQIRTHIILYASRYTYAQAKVYGELDCGTAIVPAALAQVSVRQRNYRKFLHGHTYVHHARRKKLALVNCFACRNVIERMRNIFRESISIETMYCL